MKILIVCTGNICRSPMAEHLLREGLAERGVTDVTVSSAGTQALVGEPIQEHAATTIHPLDATSFRARLLTTEVVTDAELVLCATREHRAAAVTLHPRGAARTFTLREFDRLLSAVDPATLPDRREGLVKAAAAQRGLVRAERPEDDDIADPYRRSLARYAACGAQLRESLARLVELLAGPAG